MPEQLQFYTDQHIPLPVVAGLRRRGINVLTVQEVGRCGMSDQDQLDFANGEDRVLVSFDSDVLVLHQSGSTHRGIAWCPANKYSIGELIQMLVLMHAVIAPAEMINRVEHL